MTTKTKMTEEEIKEPTALEPRHLNAKLDELQLELARTTHSHREFRISQEEIRIKPWHLLLGVFLGAYCSAIGAAIAIKAYNEPVA